MVRQCGYCVYMDVSNIKEGQFKCEKKGVWKFANSDEANSCYSYCERFRKDMNLGDKAINESVSYIASHQSYNATGCYITTIVVNILGLPDNCIELETLRKFRCEYLQKDSKYADLLIKYDALGPVIARVIANLDNAFDVASDLYMAYIKGTVLYLKNGKIDEAIEIYTEMMNNLIKEYLSSYLIPNTIKKDYDLSQSGHGRMALN